MTRTRPPPKKARARIIRSAIDAQIAIARKPDPKQQIFLNARRKAATLIREGFLQVPGRLTLIGPDNGRRLLEDHGAIAAGGWLLNTPLTLELERTGLNHLEGRLADRNVVTRARNTGFACHRITGDQRTQTVFGILSRL